MHCTNLLTVLAGMWELAPSTVGRKMCIIPSFLDNAGIYFTVCSC